MYKYYRELFLSVQFRSVTDAWSKRVQFPDHGLKNHSHSEVISEVVNTVTTLTSVLRTLTLITLAMKTRKCNVLTLWEVTTAAVLKAIVWLQK